MKKFLKIAAVLVIVLLLALVAIPFLIPTETLKVKVTEELSKVTGRTITIEGPATLKLFPDIAIALEKVTLGNPAGGFASERMFYAEKLDTGVRLMPLLKKEIIITGVTLDGAEINLEETKAGVKNWEFASKSNSDTKQEKAEEEGATSKFAIGDIAITNSSVNYSPANGQSFALGKINVALSGADGNTPLALDGDAEYKNERISIALDVKDSHGFLKGTPSQVVADVALPGGKIRFNGTAEKKTDIGAKGDLKVDIASLPSLLQWATGKPAADKLPQQFSLSGPVTLSGKRISFSQFNAKADNITTSGKLAIDLTSNVPSLVGNLKLGVIDMARFSNSAEATGKAPAAGGDGWSSKPMDLSGLKAVNAKLGLAIDGIKSGKLELGTIAADVNLQGGALKLGIDRLALYGGNAKGTVSLSTAGIASALDVTGVQIEPLMIALNGKSRLSGTGSMDLNLQGRGTSQKALVSSLGGHAKFMFRDGAVKGINLGKFLRDAKKGFMFGSESEKTDFAELGASFAFANGIGTTSDIGMKAPVLRLTGNGTINLPNRSLNLKLLPTLVASTKGQDGKDKSGLTIPLLVTGNWSNPSVTPDIGGMLQEGLRDPAALKDNLNSLKEGFKGLNSPKDIGKALLGGGSEPAPVATTDPAAPAPAVETAPAKDPKQEAIENLFKSFGN